MHVRMRTNTQPPTHGRTPNHTRMHACTPTNKRTHACIQPKHAWTRAPVNVLNSCAHAPCNERTQAPLQSMHAWTRAPSSRAHACAVHGHAHTNAMQTHAQTQPCTHACNQRTHATSARIHVHTYTHPIHADTHACTRPTARTHQRMRVNNNVRTHAGTPTDIACTHASKACRDIPTHAPNSCLHACGYAHTRRRAHAYARQPTDALMHARTHTHTRASNQHTSNACTSACTFATSTSYLLASIKRGGVR
jgi:hypothetical protein